jgi:predicted DNA-binding transcriptional regulator YafY
MRRADRLFDIIQILRSQAHPITASDLAGLLEVNIRTVYRDIVTLQARRVPIEGAAGIGYVLRRGFDLPPLMFTTDEIDAIVLGARMVRRVRDTKLHAAADRVLEKVTSVLPEALRAQLAAPAIYVSEGSAAVPAGIDPAAVRDAIRARRKLRIAYADVTGQHSRRTIWPIAMAYYVDVTLLAAWCELRADYRHFRIERIAACEMLPDSFPDDDGQLMAGWLALQKDRAPNAET